ncbi:class I SAM-dependent methyltransferase [uncultured Eudoraea sp.]|uniref:class I SAM-dependent methyltransferase n=1 Tax=uncultured Eudoraea sp. TaxID=1035614 RepID=UPI00261C47D1|nr:class I SAM-dependent methyltransferase [uncultured Eudoraea sp.]
MFLVFVPEMYCQYSESEWKARDKWMKVAEIFQIANIQVGNKVADIGCHQGYMSIRLSDFIGETGSVYSVDVREDRLNKLNDIVSKRGIGNIHTILGDYDDPKLQENSIDVVFIIDAYHEMNDYKQILFHVKKALKPDGRILILEKLKQQMIGKSRQEQTQSHTIAPKYVKNELKEAGFEVIAIEKDLGYWEEDKDKKIWVMVGVLTQS